MSLDSSNLFHYSSEYNTYNIYRYNATRTQRTLAYMHVWANKQWIDYRRTLSNTEIEENIYNKHEGWRFLHSSIARTLEIAFYFDQPAVSKLNNKRATNNIIPTHNAAVLRCEWRGTGSKNSVQQARTHTIRTRLNGSDGCRNEYLRVVL